ncbi:MAG TPA: aminoacyl-tRNA hydrolase [Ignavibacteriaceae bacterium]|nr:aminoacyl-tRNA hydrolase [Ignavibacteriaceae bacterium]
MKLIVGIGNPGRRYENNRHNVGFMFLDYMASSNSLRFIPSKADYNYASGMLLSSSFLLVKPSTYVNQSGVAVCQVLEEYKSDLSDLLVVFDDMNLDLGIVKANPSGGDGGHNGMSSIIYQLNSDQFPRIRIGIGKNFPKGEMADYVLSDFSKEEFEILGKSFLFSKIFTEEFIKGGVKQLLDANSRLLSAGSGTEEKQDSNESGN